MKTTLMMREAAARSERIVNVVGAWGDTQAGGKVGGCTEGGSPGWTDVAVEVSELPQLLPPSWECC